MIMQVRSATFGLIVASLLAACGQGQQAAPTPPPPAVTVASPISRNIIDYDEYVGRFVPVDAVEVRARVSGYLDGVHFNDGQIVKQGDLLFTIDKRPFQNALDQARANLALARSNLTYTEADLGRGKQLLRDKTISDQVFEQRSQAKRNAEASVQATIVSLDPIRFEFTFDEAAYLRYERFANTGREVTSRSGSVIVQLRLIDEADFVHRGYMDFVDNVIERGSGTIRGRAVFANADGVFTPGMFGRVRVPGSPAYPALLVPDEAIASEQARKYVLVVDAENTAQIRYVTPGQLINNMRAIKDGLKPDDRVVVNGMMRARPGTKVTPEEQAQAKKKAATPATTN
jgi:multidrug efflux system membrane fusion protein